MTTCDPQPTSQLPALARKSAKHFESLDPVRGAWPGFPFPPPLMGIDFNIVDKAAALHLSTVADLVHSGEMSLNSLFAQEPVDQACTSLRLPPAGLRVVPAAALYTLGTLHGGRAGASLSALFAAPSIIQIARLRHAALQLDR
jgi:hypothetical protein